MQKQKCVFLGIKKSYLIFHLPRRVIVPHPRSGRFVSHQLLWGVRCFSLICSGCVAYSHGHICSGCVGYSHGHSPLTLLGVRLFFLCATAPFSFQLSFHLPFPGLPSHPPNQAGVQHCSPALHQASGATPTQGKRLRQFRMPHRATTPPRPGPCICASLCRPST